MLPSKNRAPRSMFAVFKAKGRSVRKIAFGEFEVFYEKGSQPARIGIVVAKTTAKKAVSRNRIKRIVSEALREQLMQIGGRLLIVVKRDISMLKMADVKERIVKIIKKLND